MDEDIVWQNEIVMSASLHRADNGLTQKNMEYHPPDAYQSCSMQESNQRIVKNMIQGLALMSPENTDRMEGHDHAHILLKFID